MPRAKEVLPTGARRGGVVAPIVGAAGGALVVNIAVEKFKLKRPVAAFGTAALSLIAARNAKGAARAGFEAAAIASICIGVTELLTRILQPKAQPVAKAQGAPSPARDAVRSSEFRDALAKIEAKHAAEVEAHQATLHGLLNQLRQARQGTHETPILVEQAPHEPAAAAERMAAIYPLLHEVERQRWSTMVGTMPKEELVCIERQLLQRTPAEGVAYLRSTVLSPSRLPS